MARKEKPRYDGRCRERTGPPPAGVEPVVRFKNPQEGSVVIEDLVKGRVVISNGELDDLVIARSDGSPTYNLTVVVDDLDMEITHVPIPVAPMTEKWVSGSVVVSCSHPPAAFNASGAAISTPAVIRMPLKMSNATTEPIPAMMV